MSQLNTRANTFNAPRTHEGAPAKRITPMQQLNRTVMTCMLWEKNFYEDGVSVADRIATLVPQVQANVVAQMAIDARTQQRLRHVPLLLCVEQARNGTLRADTLARVIQRADELTEFLALYWKDGKCPLSAQVKKGLAKAFRKFDAYQLAKYDRSTDIKLRDVLFLTHAKPENEGQEAVWKALVDGTLESPDTWEVNLSAGEDKRGTFTRLITENRLGYMALLRNLRNMEKSGVDRAIVRKAIVDGAEHSKALPFRFIAAANSAPQFEDVLEKAMFLSTENMERLRGHTVIAVDVSGSMGATISARSQMTRFDAAAGLAMLVRELSDDVTVYAYGSREVQVAPRRGFALRDAIQAAETGWSTQLGRCVNTINSLPSYDRAIIITDEQSHDSVPAPKGTGYVINVATYQNGVGYGKWIHIDGWSESVVGFIQELEKSSF